MSTQSDDDFLNKYLPKMPNIPDKLPDKVGDDKKEESDTSEKDNIDLKNIGNTIGDTFDKMKEDTSKEMDKLSTSSTNSMSSVKGFLDSNSLITKFCFLLFVIFIFIILLSLSINVISNLFSNNSNQRLVNGMINASSQMLTITQNPNVSGSKTIYRSINESDGIEFTWSVWIYINELNDNGKFKHVFSKGNYGPNNLGINQPNNAPGLYISPVTNAVTMSMNSYNEISEEVVVPDIPLNKWVNIMIICRNQSLDVYINGLITKSLELSGVPKQNYGDVYVAMNGGFNGYISNLWYYSYALGTLAIQNLVQNGPNTSVTDSSTLNMKNPDYLSLRWYFDGTQSGYFP